MAYPNLMSSFWIGWMDQIWMESAAKEEGSRHLEKTWWELADYGWSVQSENLWNCEQWRQSDRLQLAIWNKVKHYFIWLIHFQYNFRCNQGSQSDHSIFELAFSIWYFIIVNILCFREACGIQHDDVFIITGGRYTMEIVSKYGKNGWVKDLPKLQTGRLYHGCGHFFSAMNELVKLIIQKMNTTRK